MIVIIWVGSWRRMGILISVHFIISCVVLLLLFFPRKVFGRLRHLVVSLSLFGQLLVIGISQVITSVVKSVSGERLGAQARRGGVKAPQGHWGEAPLVRRAPLSTSRSLWIVFPGARWEPLLPLFSFRCLRFLSGAEDFASLKTRWLAFFLFFLLLSFVL